LEKPFLYNNKLNGPIPDWINNLNSLFYVDLSSNTLTGQISTALTDLQMLKTDNVAPKVFELAVYKDPSIQYRIPNAFPNELNLRNSNFTGTIPK